MDYNQHIESLLEATVYKKKFGGAESAGNKTEVIGKKFVDNISLMRELSIELAHFDNLVEGATKIKPMDNKVFTELQKARKAIQSAYDCLSKTVQDFPVVMPDSKIKIRKK